MKVAFYCQHLLGIGHVSRSLSIVNGLATEFSVTYVQGGPPVPLRPVASVRLVQLDPLLMREEDSSLYDPVGARPVEEVFQARRQILARLATEGFDAVVIELFPFGRKKFGPEVRSFLAALRAANPRVRVISSVRDILVEKTNAASRDQKIVDLVNAEFHEVWVHSDPNLIRFEDTFPAASALRVPLHYTGFVAEPARAAAGLREKKILLSLGGGSVGEELFRAAAKVVPAFPEYHFHFVLGPYTGQHLREELREGLKAHLDRVIFSGLLTNFEEALAGSALSLSMAGYNTVMNLLNTRTPGLVLSYDANHEQRIRAELLEQRGYLKLLGQSDLAPAALERAMRERLVAPYPADLPDLSGARRCVELLGRP